MGMTALLFRGGLMYLHRGLYRQGLVGDASIHFGIIRQLKKAPRSRYIEQYLIGSEPMSYPTLFHRYCALFPGDLYRKSYLPNLLLFSLAATAFIIYFRYVETAIVGDTGWAPVAVAAVVFLAAPHQWTFLGPGLAYISLSERLMARIFSGGFFVFAVIGSPTGDALSQRFAVIAAACAMATAIFARQSLTTPLLALLLWDAMPLIELLAGFLLALALSRDHLLRGFRHTLLTWKMYATHTKKSDAIRRNLMRFPDWRYLWEVRFHPRELTRRALQYEPARSIVHYPEIILAFGLCVAVAATGQGMLRAVAFAAMAMCIAATSVYIATTTERLNHLGESYRYLEYGLYFTAPMAIGLLTAAVPGRVADIGFAWFAAATLAAPFLAYRLMSGWIRWPDRDVFGEFLREMDLPAGAVVFPIGLQVAGDACARRADVKSFWYQPGVISEEIYRDFIDEWPFLKRDAGPLIEKYGVTHAICDKTLLPLLPWPLSLPGMRRCAENERYIGFRYVLAGAAPDGFAGEIIYPPAKLAA